MKQTFLSALGLDRLSQNELMNDYSGKEQNEEKKIDEMNNESLNIQLSLNPNAAPFTPNSSNNNSPLSPIAEDDSDYDSNDDSKDDNEWICDNLYRFNDNILQLRYIIFISGDITRSALRKNAILEYFCKEQDLFYHLRWQCRMQVIDKKYKIFKSNINNKELIIFHSGLHNNQNIPLYIIGTQNDVNKSHSVKWKMIQFMTPNEIYLIGINNNNLPLSSRDNLYNKLENETNKFMKDLQNYEINIHNVMKIEQIKKKHVIPNQLIVTFTEFNKQVKYSIQTYQLLPIIWFNKRRHNSNYKIQMLLPINLRNNWIGIVFDYNNNGKLIPVTICVDHIDIQRKLALFKPFQNENEYKWFENNITEIKAKNDEYQTVIWLKNERIKALEKQIYEQQQEYLKQIKERDDEIKRLKGLKGNEIVQD